MKEREKRRWQNINNNNKKKPERTVPGIQKLRDSQGVPETALAEESGNCAPPVALLMSQTATKELPEPRFSRGEKP